MNIKVRNLIVTIVAMVAVAAVLVGCKDDGPSTQTFVKDGTQCPIKIAILDFTNLVPRSDEAGRVVTNAVVTYMLSTRAFDVVEPGVVDQAMKENRIIPPASGLDAKSAKQLADSLKVDAILTGTVEEYGEVRIGNETYPAVSFSARLISAKDASIIWAGTISRTGADKVLLFDIRRISSMGKLVKSAVESMAMSMRGDEKRILACLIPNGNSSPTQTQAQASAAAVTAAVKTDSEPAHGSTMPQAVPAVEKTPATETTSTATPDSAPVTTAVNTTPAAGGKSADESKTYSEDDLTALLVDVAGYTKKDVQHKKHYHDMILARYQIGDGTNFVDVKLVDYLKLAQTQKFLQQDHADETVGDFAGVPAFTGTSQFNYMHIDAAVGRFGLYISGPAGKKVDVEKLATALINAIK